MQVPVASARCPRCGTPRWTAHELEIVFGQLQADAVFARDSADPAASRLLVCGLVEVFEGLGKATRCYAGTCPLLCVN